MKKYLFIALLALCLFAPQKGEAAIYYIDFTNGKDTNDGLGTTTDRAFQSLQQFANNARSAGDTAYVRRDMASTTNMSDITFTSDGDLNNPIVISADYDDLWDGFTTLPQTATPVFGSKTITVSASSTAVHNSWIYFGTDCTENATTSVAFIGQKVNPCEYAYEVASSTAGTASTVLTLYMPYKGPSSGAGVTIRQMGKAPQWGATNGSSDFNFNMSADQNWLFKGIDIRSTDSNGCIASANSFSVLIVDTICQADGASSSFLSGGNLGAYIKKTRIFNINNGNSSGGTFADILLDCNNLASSIGFPGTLARTTHRLYDVNVINCTDTFTTSGVSGTEGRTMFGRNISRNSTITGLSGVAVAKYFFEDDFGIVGLNSQSSNQISSDAIGTTTMATTTNLRSGGGPKNLVIFPPSGTANTGISTKYFPNSYIKLFEYPIYADTSSKTYSMWFNSTSTSNFTVSPLTATATGSTTPELYIECEYYAASSGADRFLKRSNTSDATQFSSVTTWEDISVTCQPTQAGILYLRGWYAKPKETPTNYFYMDTTPTIQ